MELKLTVNYQPRIITDPVRCVRCDGNMQNVLTDTEKFTYDAEFWNEYRDKFYLQTGTIPYAFKWCLRDLIEPVVDTNIIDVTSYEVLNFDSKFDKNTYAVQFETIVRFDLCDGVDGDELYIHKNRLVDLITNWLNEDELYHNYAFIRAGDEDFYADFGNVTVYYNIVVEREDVDVEIEIRK